MLVNLSVEVLLLLILSSLTIIGAMIAINARGMARVAVSFLLVAILVSITVFAGVSYKASAAGASVVAEVEGRAERERQILEKQLAAHDELLRRQKEESAQDKIARGEEARQISAWLQDAQQLARTLEGRRMRDPSRTYQQLTAQASGDLSRARTIESRLQQMKSSIDQYNVILPVLESGAEALLSSARAYVSYYRADNSQQEQMFERTIRQQSAAARREFNSAQTSLNSTK